MVCAGWCMIVYSTIYLLCCPHCICLWVVCIVYIVYSFLYFCSSLKLNKSTPPCWRWCSMFVSWLPLYLFVVGYVFICNCITTNLSPLVTVVCWFACDFLLNKSLIWQPTPGCTWVAIYALASQTSTINPLPNLFFVRSFYLGHLFLYTINKPPE